MLRTLGFGAAGIGLGGLALGACSSDGATTAAGGTTTTAGGTTAGGASTTAAAAPAEITRASYAYDPSKPYWVQGNFAPVTTEETVTQLTVKGTIPSDLSGLFVRNGSNPQTGEALHWFLGDGMIHGVRIEGGKAAWYRNRYVQTPIAASKKDLMGYGGIPGKDVGQSNVSVIHHAGKLLSLGEVGWPWEVSTADLATVGAWDYAGKLGDNMTAHPKIDPATGKMHFFGYEFLKPALTYYVAGTDGALETVSSVPVDKVTMIHDFAITESDAVFWLGPVLFGADANNPNPSVPFHWDPEAGPCRVGVMPLGGDGGDIRWVDIDPCFVFHGFNAHRDGDDVVLQLHKLPQAFGPLGDIVPSHLTEWRINTAGDQLTFAEKQLSDREMDLPAHDRRYTGRQSRHGWFATTVDQSGEHGFELTGLCHLDLQTGKEDVWDHGNRRAGEGFFVPTGKGEGEGWVLSYLWDRTTDLSSLGIFDAQDLAKGPVAEVELPVRVPFGFHGWWVDEADL